MKQLTERPAGTISVWDQTGYLLLRRPMRDRDEFPRAAHQAVAAARNLAGCVPRHVTVDIGGERIARVVDGSFLRDPREFLRMLEWPGERATRGLTQSL